MYIFYSIRNHGYVKLLVHGASEILLSREGVARGNPLSMYMYAGAILPLMHIKLKDPDKSIQIGYYADDSACAGKLSQLHGNLATIQNQ